MHKVKWTGSLVLALAVMSCRLGDDQSGYVAESITREARAAGMSLPAPSCHQLPGRRAGTCESTATAAEVARATAHLGYVKSKAWTAAEGCGALGAWRLDAGTSVDIYTRDPASSAPPAGRIHVIWFVPATGAVCLDMTWSVG